MERSFAGKVLATACLSLLWVTSQAHAQSCSDRFWEIEIKHACQNTDCTETASRQAPLSDTTTSYDHLENGGVREDYANAYSSLLKNYVVTVRDVCKGPMLSDGELTCSKGISDFVRTVGDLRTVTSDIFLMTNSGGTWEVAARYADGIDLLDNEIVNLPVPNVCTDSTCSASMVAQTPWASADPISVVTGLIQTVNAESLDRPKFILLPSSDKENQLANETIVFDAKIEDPHAEGCENEIDYSISVVPMAGGAPLYSFDETTKNKDIAGMKFFLSETSSGVSALRIRETLNIPKTGLWKIRVTFTDPNGNAVSGNSYKTIEIIPNYPASSPTSNVVSLNDYGMQYYIGDNLMYDVHLKDASGNYITGVLPSITVAHPTQNADITWIGNPSGNTFQADANGAFTLNMRFWAQKVFNEKFVVTYQKWDRFGARNGEYATLDFDLGKQLFIKDPAAASSWDFSIACTKNNITLKATCVADDLSGCNVSESVTFTSESQNGTQGTLKSIDKAGNVKQFVYKMSHIDRTAPVIASATFNGSDTFPTSIKAKPNDTVEFRITDARPEGCASPLSVVSGTLSYPGASGTVTDNFVGNLWGSSAAALTVTRDFNKIGTANLSNIVFRDRAGNTATFLAKSWTIVPAQPSIIRSTLELASGTRNTVFPGGEYQYVVTLKDAYDNPIYNKPITSLAWAGAANDKRIKTNMTDTSVPTWDNAENFPFIGTSTDANGRIGFKTRSIAPGEFSEHVTLKMNDWNENYVSNSDELPLTVGSDAQKNSFLNPHKGTFGISGGLDFKLGASINAILTVAKSPSASLVPAAYELEQFRSKLQSTVANHVVLDAQDASPLNGNPEIEFRVDATSDSALTTPPGVIIENGPFITYSLDGKNVTYTLRNSYDPLGGPLSIWGSKGAEGGVRIVGNLQGKGKGDKLGQKENFTQMTASQSRNLMRKTVEKAISGMKSGETKNGIYYVENQDVTISALPTYETIVVRWGNVIINTDINKTSLLGIVSLRKDSSNASQGNVYVNMGVRYVNAAIYADGGFVSSWFLSGQDRVENYRESTQRTTRLSKQLVVRGALFTSNTIGGGVMGSAGKYTLPSGKLTTDYGRALAYDLNLFRKSNDGFDKTFALGGTSDLNLGYTEPLVILYDPIVATKPPKGFR